MVKQPSPIAFQMAWKIVKPMAYLPYTRNFSRYEIFAEQEANRIFAIIFLRIAGSSWKGSMLFTIINLQLLQTSKFSRIKFSLYQQVTVKYTKFTYRRNLRAYGISLARRMVISNQVVACTSQPVASNGHPNTPGHLTGLRNKIRTVNFWQQCSGNCLVY